MVDTKEAPVRKARGPSDFTKVTRGALASLSGTGVGMISTLVTAVLLIRTLGIDGYGRLTLAIAVVTVVQGLSGLGLPQGAARMLAFAKGKNDEVGFRRMLKASIFVGLAAGTTGAVLIVSLRWLGVIERFGSLELLAVASLLLLTSGVRSALYGSLRALQDVRALFKLSVSVPLIDVTTVGILVLLGVQEIIWYAGFLVVAAYLEVGMLIFLSRRRGRTYGSLFDTTWADAKALLSFSLPFVLVQFMFLTIHQADVVMLGAFHPPSTLGLYTPVMRLGQTVEKVLSAFPVLYVPIATAYFAQNRIADIRNLFLTVSKWAYGVAFTIVLAIFVAPDVVLPILFGGPYQGMVTEARILAIGYWAMLVTGLNGVTLGAMGLQKRAAAVAGIAVVANLAVGLLLIPPFAAAGAAWTNTITYLLVNVAYSVVLYRASGISPFRRDTISLFLYSLFVLGIGLAATELLDLRSTIQGLALLMAIALTWVLGVAFGRPFKMEWGDMKEAFLIRGKRRDARERARNRNENGMSGPASEIDPPSLTTQEAGADEPFPIFVGRGRSGTTLFRAIFDSHPAMAIPPESPFLVSLAYKRRRYENAMGFDKDAFVADLVTHRRFDLWDQDEKSIRECIEESTPRDYPQAVRAIYGLYARARGKQRYADKSPRTTGSITLLAHLFPEARFIHIVRDGRDVALSHLEVDFGSEDIVEAALDWRREVGACRRSGRRLGANRYREIRYEDLIDDPERCVRDVCDFIQLEFDGRMLRYFERADDLVGTTPTPSAHGGLFLPPTKGLRDWRSQMSEEDAATFEVLAGSLLGDLGYERTTDSVTMRTRIDARQAQARRELPRRVRRLKNHLKPARLFRRAGVGTRGL